ncbi:MAG: hypothetical protein NTY03_04280 [Candidatus Bathyarchaeota archaeon]|nr:hypothetical protein [Candidatus Bathyarchaeota archaeon]
MEKNKEWTEVGNTQGLWLPVTKGEVLEGVVIEVKEGLYGLQLSIENKEGVHTTPSHKALVGRLKAFQVGDSIKVEYLGTELPKVKGQQGTRLYSVFRKPNLVEPTEAV